MVLAIVQNLPLVLRLRDLDPVGKSLKVAWASHQVRLSLASDLLKARCIPLEDLRTRVLANSSHQLILEVHSSMDQ